MSLQRKPLPAYATDLANARRKGLTLRNPTVSVVLHWRRRPSIGYGVVVPDAADPAALDWSWCRNLEVIVFRRSDAAARVVRTVAAIERARPRRLLVVDVGDECVISIVDPSAKVLCHE